MPTELIQSRQRFVHVKPIVMLMREEILNTELSEDRLKQMRCDYEDFKRIRRKAALIWKRQIKKGDKTLSPS